VMAFSEGSGDEVTGPCVGLCVVASGSQRCGNESCVGPVERAVLDGSSSNRRRVSPVKKKMVWRERWYKAAVARPRHGARVMLGACAASAAASVVRGRQDSSGLPQRQAAGARRQCEARRSAHGARYTAMC
jgi:hypothetical protein